MLVIVIALAIVMLLYVIQMDTLFGPQMPAKPEQIQERPWIHENLLLPAEETVKKPKAPKPLLTEDFQLAGQADRNGQPRGQVTLSFSMDGRLKTDWQCEYTADGTTHQLASQTAGNVAVKMAYEDEQGPDETRLFFISKGDYVHTKSTPETAAIREKGTAWVIGWLRPDRTADGFVTITTDRKWSIAFAFKAAPVK